VLVSATQTQRTDKPVSGELALIPLTLSFAFCLGAKITNKKKAKKKNKITENWPR